jgi:hypothetical protein
MYEGVPDSQLTDGELRKKYWKELLQPSDPRFYLVYGKQIVKNEKLKKMRIKEASKLWEQVQVEIKRRIKDATHYTTKTKGSKILE